jgi:hypothetical protein
MFQGDIFAGAAVLWRTRRLAIGQRLKARPLAGAVDRVWVQDAWPVATVTWFACPPV